MKMGYGWTGKLLRIDLRIGNGPWSLRKGMQAALSAHWGVGLKIFWDEVSEDVGALDA